MVATVVRIVPVQQTALARPVPSPLPKQKGVVPVAQAVVVVTTAAVAQTAHVPSAPRARSARELQSVDHCDNKTGCSAPALYICTHELAVNLQLMKCWKHTTPNQPACLLNLVQLSAYSCEVAGMVG